MKKMDPENYARMQETEELIETQEMRDINTLVKYLRSSDMEDHLKLVYKHRAHFTALFNSKQYKKPRVTYK